MATNFLRNKLSEKSFLLQAYTFVFIVKVLWLGLSFFLWQENHGKNTFKGGDTNSYIIPAKNLFKTGVYSSDANKIEEISGTRRMPLYGLIYSVFWWVGGDTFAGACVILLQLLSEYFTYLLVANLLYEFYVKSLVAYSIVLIIGGFSTYITPWSFRLLPETTGMFFLVFSTYFYLKFKHTTKTKYGLLTSTGILCLTMLKPYWGIVLPLFSLDFLLRHYKNFKRLLPHLGIMYSVFFLFIGAWTLRNYIRFKKFIPLTYLEITDDPLFDRNLEALRKMLVMLGETTESWDTKSLASRFYYKEVQDVSSVSIPEVKYSECFNRDSLIALSQFYYNNLKNYQEFKEGVTKEEIIRITRKIENYNQCLEEHYFFQTRVLNPMKLAVKVILHPSTYALPFSVQDKNSFRKILKTLVKLYHAFWSVLVSALGVVGGILYFRRAYLFVIYELFLIVLFIFVFEGVELRYFITTYPFRVLLASWLIYRAASYALQKKKE